MAITRYYKLEHSLDLKVIGSYFPQLQDFYGKVADCEVIDFIASYVEDIPNISKPIKVLNLKKKTKLTDFISSVMFVNGFIVSRRLREILDQFYIKKTKYFPLSIVHGNDVIKTFNFLYIASDYSSNIDFERTVFCVRDSIKNKDVKLKNIFEFKEYCKKIYEEDYFSEIYTEKIYVNNVSDLNVDVLCFGVFDFNYYISQKLKDRLEKENITGFEINKYIEISFTQTPS
jgi:hypothetical protein